MSGDSADKRRELNEKAERLHRKGKSQESTFQGAFGDDILIYNPNLRAQYNEVINDLNNIDAPHIPEEWKPPAEKSDK